MPVALGKLMSSDAPNISRLVRQHAETVRLMGVDFMPVYRPKSAGGDGAGDRGRVEPQSPPTLDLRAEPKPASVTPVAPVPVVIEVKSPPVAPPAAPGAAPKRSGDRLQSQQLLDALRARYEADAPHKHFVTAHSNIVWGEGDPCARLMFVGEAPGEEEDRTGRPFVGRAGQLLDKMIIAMGLSRSEVYIANVLKTRPPNNATPTLEESRLCAPYLYEQIGIIAPEVIVTLGLPASRTLLNSMETMGRMRGNWAEFKVASAGEPRVIPVMPTYHPAYLLRNYTPQERAKVWSDLQLVMGRLGLSKPAGGGEPGASGE